MPLVSLGGDVRILVLIIAPLENLYRPLIPHPLKILCYAALADLFTYLRASKADPEDVIARQKLQVASWMSIWPIKLGKYSALGISHALGHKLGARYHIPHGITSVCWICSYVYQSFSHRRWL